MDNYMRKKNLVWSVSLREQCLKIVLKVSFQTTANIASESFS